MRSKSEKRHSPRNKNEDENEIMNSNNKIHTTKCRLCVSERNSGQKEGSNSEQQL